MKVVAVIVAAIVVIAAIGAFVLIYKPGTTGENGENGNGNQPGANKSQFIIYDPTGTNIKAPSGGRGGSDLITAYLVNITGDKITSKTPVQILGNAFPSGKDPAKPMILAGKFGTLANSNGTITVNSIVQTPDQIISNGSFTGSNFKNVVTQMSSISVVVHQHTFGFGYGRGGEPIAYVSVDKKPTFFTNITIRGVVLPTTVGAILDFLDLSLDSEFSAFQGAFRTFGDAANISGFNLGINLILADSIAYDTPITIDGDVIDIITPTDVQNFIQAVDSDAKPESYKFITDILAGINMELIVMIQKNIVWDSVDMWFVVGTTDLTRDETIGQVKLNIAEVTQYDIERELNISIPDSSSNSSLRIRYGVSGDSDNKTSITKMEVRDCWSTIGASASTAAKGVSVDGFAMVLTLNDSITYLEAVFQTDASTLKRLTTVRNPGVGLLIDYNFTDVLDISDIPFTHYLALVLLPDFNLGQGQPIYLVHVEGVVYDLGKFLKNSDWQFPVVIGDKVTEGPAPTSYTLKDIHDGALGNRSISHISTDGFATGTTMKTVGPILVPEIEKSPIDVDLYEIYYPGDDGIRYHTALVGFNLTKDTGPTYIMQHVRVDGFYINMSKFFDRISNSMSLGSKLGAGSLISEIVNAVGKLTGDQFLIGAMVGYKIIPVPVEPKITVTSFHAYSTVINRTADESSISIEGDVINQGDAQLMPTVRMAATSESGVRIFRSGNLALSGGASWLPSVALLSGGTAHFKFDEQLSSTDAPAGNYTVDIYIMDWMDSLGMGQKLGETHGKFVIFDSPETPGLEFTGQADWISLTLDYNINLTLNLTSPGITISAPPLVHYWSGTFLGLFPSNISMTSSNDLWTLIDVWTGGNFHLYIDVSIQYNGQDLELRTQEWAI